MKKSIFTFLLASFSLSVFAGGGWPQPQGKGYIKLYEWFVLSNKYFDFNGNVQDDVDRTIFNTTVYAEYGLTDQLTVMANVPYSIATKDGLVKQTVSGLGDAQVGLTYGLTSGTLNTSASVILGIPLGTSDGGALNDIQTGDGEFNQLIKVDAGLGYNLFGLGAYANFYAGYNNRSKGFSDEYRYGGETGVKLLNEDLFVVLKVDGVLPRENGDPLVGVNPASLFANNTEYLAITPEFNVFFTENTGLSVAIGGVAYAKKNFANPSFAVGVFSKF